MRGTIILSEGRSGTNWLESLTKDTGVLGNSAEWVDATQLNVKPQITSCAKYIDLILEHASTENKFFMIKMFPRHLYWFEAAYGVDLIDVLTEDHELAFILITRKDRLRQAISFSRALQNSAWTSLGEKKKKERYDFSQIYRCYIGIEESYTFWRNYLKIKQLPYKHFAYEDLLPNPEPFMHSVASHANVTNARYSASALQIQRDDITEEWMKKFCEDAKRENVIKCSNQRLVQKTNLKGFIRFFKGKLLKPTVPYTIR